MISEIIGGVINVYKQLLKRQQRITKAEIKKEQLRLEEEEKAKKEGKPIKEEKRLFGGKIKVDLNGIKIESKKERERKERLRSSDKKRSFIENRIEAKKCEAVKNSKRKELILRTKIILLTILKYVVKIIEMFIKFLISVLGVFGFAVVLFVIVLMIVIYGILQIEFVAPSSDILVTDNDDCIPGEYILEESGVLGADLGALNNTLTPYQQNLYKTFSLVEEFLKGDGTNTPLMKDLPFDVANKVFRGIPAVESSFEIFGTSDISHDVLKDMLDSSEDDSYIGPHQIDKDSSLYYGEYYKFWQGTSFVDSWVQKYPKPNSSVKDHFWMPYSVAMSIMHSLNMGSYGMLNPSVNGYDDFEAFVNNSMDHFGIQANREECFQYIRALLSVSCYLQGQSMAFLDYDTGYGGGAGRINYLCAVFAASSEDDSKRSFNNYSIILNNETRYKYAEGSGSLREWLIGSQGYDSYISDIGTLEIGGDKNPRIKVENTELTVPLMRYIYDKYKDDPFMSETWTHIKGSTGQFLSSYHYGIACLLQGNHIVAELGLSAPITSGGSMDDCECVDTGSSGFVGNIDLSTLKAGVAQGDWPEDVLNKMSKYGWNEFFGHSYGTDNPNAQLSATGMTYEEWRQSTKWKVPYQNQFVGGSSLEPGYGTVSRPYTNSQGGTSYIKHGNACHIYMSSYIASALTGKFINMPEMYAALMATGGATPLFMNVGAHVTFEKLGICFSGMKKDGTLIEGTSKSECSIIYPKGNTIQEKINAVLDAGGIVGVSTEKGNYTESGHYFVITERNGDKYKTASASHPMNDVDWQTLDFIIGPNGSDLRVMGDGSSFYFAYNPNLKVSSGGSLSAVTNSSTIEIPSDLKQSGLLKDYTNYTYFFSKWAYNQRKVADLWDQKGRQNDKGIATIDGFYLVAAKDKFGQCGDAIQVLLEDGTTINCILGDIKGSDAQSPWGHEYPTGVSLIEWEAFGTADSSTSGVNIELGDWENKKIKSITNLGSFLNGEVSMDSVGSSNNSYDVECIPSAGGSDSSSLGSIDLGVDVIDKVAECEKSWGPNNSGKLTNIENITIHYWGNDIPTKAQNSSLIGWYSGTGAKYMAHFIVDSESIVQTAPLDIAVQHAGGDNGFGTGGVGRLPFLATSNNSIGIEVGNSYIDTDGNGSLDTFVFERSTVENALKLTKALMEKYNISIDHVIRHYDHTMKDCPAPFVDSQYKRVYDNQQSVGWKAFKNALTTGNIDWSAFGSSVIEDLS